MADVAMLMRPMADGPLTLDPLTKQDREALRACCPPDDEVWAIYPTDFGGAFDASFDGLLANPVRHVFLIRDTGRAVGMTSFLNILPDRQTLEVGGTYMAPAVRGTGVNARVKRLMLGRAFGCGIRRVEFRIDERNQRSQRAVEKLGAVKEGVLRAERVTWTGHIRDTGLFSILADEWRARSTAG